MPGLRRGVLQGCNEQNFYIVEQTSVLKNTGLTRRYGPVGTEHEDTGNLVKPICRLLK